MCTSRYEDEKVLTLALAEEGRTVNSCLYGTARALERAQVQGKMKYNIASFLGWEERVLSCPLYCERRSTARIECHLINWWQKRASKYSQRHTLYKTSVSQMYLLGHLLHVTLCLFLFPCDTDQMHIIKLLPSQCAYIYRPISLFLFTLSFSLPLFFCEQLDSLWLSLTQFLCFTRIPWDPAPKSSRIFLPACAMQNMCEFHTNVPTFTAEEREIFHVLGWRDWLRQNHEHQVVENEQHVSPKCFLMEMNCMAQSIRILRLLFISNTWIYKSLSEDNYRLIHGGKKSWPDGRPGWLERRWNFFIIQWLARNTLCNELG